MHLVCLINSLSELSIMNSSLTQYQYLPHYAFATTELSFIRRKAVAKIHNKNSSSVAFHWKMAHLAFMHSKQHAVLIVHYEHWMGRYQFQFHCQGF